MFGQFRSKSDHFYKNVIFSNTFEFTSAKYMKVVPFNNI